MRNKEVLNETIDNIVYDNLPGALISVTEGFNERERDIVLLSSIGVLSSCIPNVYGYYDGDEVYANLFLIIIAPPASGKGVMNYSRILVQKIHDKIVKESKEEIDACKKDKKKAKSKDYADCPPLRVKIVPANISNAELYSFIGASNHGILIVESEADTMSNMLKNDWSNYSDVIRKVFHHEPISISRKIEKIYEEIEEPKLSIVMSGTPDQLQPLLKSKDNGLFSRFVIYTFDEISKFKNVFAPLTKDYKLAFKHVAEDIFNLYTDLTDLQERIEFQLTENQSKRFVKEFSIIHDTIIEFHPNSFIPNLNRHGLIMFRICMIFTVLRNGKEKGTNLICNNRDFLVSLEISKTVLKHALVIHNDMGDGLLSKVDEDFLFDLGITFTRKQAIELGKNKFSIPRRTVDDKLSKWRKRRAIEKIGHGKFKRVLK